MMADYKRTEVPEDVILHISPSRNTVVVQEHSANGVVSYREIDPIEFYFALNGSYTTNDYLDSGFLPEHCLHIAMNAAERRYVIWNPELRADVIYRDTEYLDFPLPRLVFSLRVLADGRVADCSMGVVADEPPTEDTPMFFYPFSNVHDNERVCTGNNILPRYKKLSAMKNFQGICWDCPTMTICSTPHIIKRGLTTKRCWNISRTRTLPTTIRIFLSPMAAH